MMIYWNSKTIQINYFNKTMFTNRKNILVFQTSFTFYTAVLRIRN